MEQVSDAAAYVAPKPTIAGTVRATSGPAGRQRAIGSSRPSSEPQPGEREHDAEQRR